VAAVLAADRLLDARRLRDRKADLA
jgi:hypothetical protein